MATINRALLALAMGYALAATEKAKVSDLTFSKTEVYRFYKQFNAPQSKYKHQRLGQAFCNHFGLHKSTQGKSLEDALWEKDGEEARGIIALHTDYSQ